MGTTMEDPADFLARIEHLDKLDEQRATAYDELKRSYRDLVTKYAKQTEDHEQERENSRLWRRELMASEKRAVDIEAELSRIKSQSNTSNPFAFAIIDGDGAVFREELIAKGTEGGEEAAHLLHEALKDHLKATNPELSINNIMVQVVLNLEGLGKALHASGVLRDNNLRDFSRGFSRAQPLFCFVDVGDGKEQSDQKVRKMFEVMEGMDQCKRLVLGPCLDNGYVPFLRPYSGSTTAASKISLLETAEVGSQYKNLSFARLHLDTIFRPDKVPSRAPKISTASSASGSSPTVGRASPIPSSTSPIQAIKPDGDGGGWASIGRNGSVVKTINIASKKDTRPYIPLNKELERLDRPLPPVDLAVSRRMNEVTKERGVNYCNRHHLSNNCAVDNCIYIHGPRLTGPELNYLRHMTRDLPCGGKSACREMSCNLGHHCKNPSNCHFRANCRFVDTHNMDQAVAYKYFEDHLVESAR